jgi:histone deacetylase 4/5
MQVIFYYILSYILSYRKKKKFKSYIFLDCSANAPDSGPNSPPVAGGSRGSPTNAPIQEENEDPQYAHTSRSSINDLSLFSSPSMPNISLGRPHLVNPHNSSHLVSMNNQCCWNHLTYLFLFKALLTSLHSSAQQQHHQQQQQQHHQQQQQQQPPPPPPYLTQTLEELAEVQAQAVAVAAANSQGISLQQHLSNLQQQHHHHQYPGVVYGNQPITDAQVAQARLHKQGQHHRPLGRTQSAPLPLQHPMLTASASINIGQTHYENSEVGVFFFFVFYSDCDNANYFTFRLNDKRMSTCC